MTTQHTEERIGRLKSITLSESSRTRMHEELSAYVDLHAYADVANSSAPTPSPFFSYFSAGFFRISAALVVLISMLGGTAYAANDALPGTTLYPIKLNLTEPVQTALIPSTEGKAAWHSILAERRLEEATDLAVAGKLDTATQGTITDNFTKHVQDSSEAATQLQQEGNVTAALSVRSDLEARITAHEDILTQVVTHLAAVATTTNDASVSATKDLLAVVHDSQSAVAGERLALEDSIDHSGAGDANATSSVAIDAKTDARADGTIAIANTTNIPAPIALRATMRKAAFHSGSTSPSSTARNTEIAAILFKNSALLTSLGVVGTTTASTTQNTASSTEGSANTTTNADGAVNPTPTSESEINLKK
ncbi:MAG: hypothetical protein JWN49_711 [Parcubacteria group bacterium]|nr:hypothetical protein [Parcubacteria group bacterium]